MTSQINRALQLAAMAGALAGAMPVLAAESSGFIMSPRVEYHNLDSEQLLDNPYLGGIGLGYQSMNRWNFELTYLRGRTELNDSNDNVTLDLLRLDALYRIDNGRDLKPFVLIGGGKQRYSQDDVEIANDMFNVGAGLDFAVNENITVRTDFRLINDMENELTSYAAGLSFHFLLGGSRSAPVQAPTPEPVPTVQPVEAPVELPSDADRDGVLDRSDRCPGTAEGAPVDADGCQQKVDDDGDGVPNEKDKCANSTAGAKVDERGCHIVISETIEETLNIVFANNSAIVAPGFYSEVERIAGFLRDYPDTEVVIEGHSDDRGPVAHNFKLSQERAEAVAKLLVERFGVDQSRVRATSFGPTQPIVANDTPENRAKNRRVVAKVSTQVQRFAE